MIYLPFHGQFKTKKHLVLEREQMLLTYMIKYIKDLKTKFSQATTTNKAIPWTTLVLPYSQTRGQKLSG